MNGSLYTWSSINSYFASYLHHKGNKIKPSDTFFLMPCIFLVQYCFMTLGVKLGDSTNARISTLIGVIIMIGSYGILIFFSNYYLVLLGMGIFGLGDGLGNLSGIKNAWKYFPNNKGLVNGIIIGGLGLSSSVFTPLADYIINKDGKKPNNDGFYDKEISERLIYFLYSMIAIFILLGTCAVAFTFPYQQTYDDHHYYNNENNEEFNGKNEREKLLGEDSEDNENYNNNNSENNYNINKVKIIESPSLKEKTSLTPIISESEGNLMEAIFSCKNLELGIFCFAGPGKNKIIKFII